MHNYEEAIDILTSKGKFYINLGLERVQRVIDLINERRCLIGMPDLLSSMKFVHVAGTNGKGSVCAMLSAILVNNPTLNVGLFTSPHVFDYTERIKINYVEIDKETFAKGVNEIVQLAEKNDIHLTEFEILTVLALKYFADNNVDIVIFETGLGGRLDATNIIESPLCSIITHIDFDHTDRLGDAIEKIAYEKAGIIKKSCPVIISKNNKGLTVIKQIAKEYSCHCEECNNEAIQENKKHGLPRQGYALPRNDMVKKMALQGTYQQENLALVLAAVDILNKNGFNITNKDVDKGLKNVKHPCRFEYLKEYNILIDGAHNPNGTKALRESLDYYFPNQKFKFIFGCLKNKEYAKMMDNLFTPDDQIYFYQFNNENSCTYEELASTCKFKSFPFIEYVKDNNTLTVICGSFYMIKELLTKIGVK